MTHCHVILLSYGTKSSQRKGEGLIKLEGLREIHKLNSEVANKKKKVNTQGREKGNNILPL